MPARIIVLNGVGSAGKSTLAGWILDGARETFMHVAMDAFLGMMPRRTFGAPEGLTFRTIEEDGHPAVEIITGPDQQRSLRAMRHAIAAMADQGCHMVVDEVMLDRTLPDYRDLLRGHDVKMVGVMSPLAVLEARERARGDRAIGLARWQFGRVHAGQTYDFTVDTSVLDAKACAQAIIDRFDL